jgi:hypothetical protein
MKKLIVLLVLMFASSVFALPGTQSWKAVWDANPELDVAGYYLYWRTPGGAFSDTDRIDVGNLQEQVLTGIVPNKTEIAVTCYDTSGNEGGLSTVVPFDTDDQAPASVGGVAVVKE